MRTYAEATPCPGVAPAARPRRVSFAQDMRQHAADTADDTENVTFTTELRGQLRIAKPRRRASVMARGGGFDPGMDIWQDVGREERSISEAARLDDGRAGARRTSTLGKPALRASVLARKAAPPADPRLEATVEVHSGSLMAQPVRPRRMSGMFQGHTETIPPPGAADRRQQSRRTSIMGGAHLPILEEPDRPHPLARSEQRAPQPHRDARRRTMWVPSDDTTVVTIHPGARSYVPDDTWRRPKAHDTGLDLVTVSEEEAENSPAAPQQKRGPRMSLAGKPRKAPLQQSRHQGGPNATIVEDVFGEGGGKENVPPGLEKVVKLDVRTGPADIVIHFDDARNSIKGPANLRRQSLRPTILAETSQQARTVPQKPSQPNQNVSLKRPGSSSILETSLATKTSRAQHRGAPVARARSSIKTWTASAADWRKDSRYNQPDVVTCNVDVHGALQFQPQPRASVYKAPVITEDLACPELYEEHWLSHQEIAITQLLNQLLDMGQTDNKTRPDHDALRRRMLRLHQDADTVALAKRLQASLQYGALAVPLDALPKVARLGTDIGMRREFLDLWLTTYDHGALRAALETIVGRELVLPKRLSGTSHTLTDGELKDKLLRRGIERYLQAFLINHDDAAAARALSGSIASIARQVDNTKGEGSQAWKWRRTMMRSLMVILLLDRAKATKVFTPCLFRKTSSHKSSASVLHALSTLLVPSAGDIGRTLAHLHYHVRTVQYPLEEYEYVIDNVAVDLRDGIVLARVVELLCFSRTSARVQSDATVTVALPTGEVLESLLNDEATGDWLLSQHLKLPCIGRAQKLYNVQISLSALAGLKGAAARVASDMTAEHIVDGHREKTMALLWGLVGQTGLGFVVDQVSLTKELRRLDGDHGDAILAEELEGEARAQVQEHLLQRWAAAVARRHGMSVTNLTTSFADGRVLDAIATEYMHHGPLPTNSIAQAPSRTYGSLHATLADKLRAIGCSTSFIALFATGDRSSSSSSSSSSGTATYPFSRSFTLLTLSYLASRLLPQTMAHRAAVVLQRRWRSRLARREVGRRVALMRLAHDCATVVMTRNRVVEAAGTLQRAWRRVLKRKEDELNGWATEVQAVVRGWRFRHGIGTRVRHEGSVRARGGW